MAIAVFPNGYANRSIALVLPSYWRVFFLVPPSLARLRDVLRHAICDLDCGPVTVCRLLLAGGTGRGCRSSCIGPRAGSGPCRGWAPPGATLRDACRPLRGDTRSTAEQRRAGPGARILPACSKSWPTPDARRLERARAPDLRPLCGGAGGAPAASESRPGCLVSFLLTVSVALFSPHRR